MPDGMSCAAAVLGFSGPADYPALLRALATRGYTADARDAILGKNLLRVVARALAAHTASGDQLQQMRELLVRSLLADRGRAVLDRQEGSVRAIAEQVQHRHH